jgi:uncharacterized protein
MNGPRYRQEKKIFKMNDTNVHADSLKLFGDFLHSYIVAYEDDNSLMRTSFLTENPLVGLEDTIEQNEKYYEIIKEKLNKYTNNYICYMDKPKLISRLIAYFGFVNEYGLFKIPSNKQKAFQYYKLSAQMNSPFGTFKLAQCYEKGVGCNKNMSKAFSFYRCAAKLGSIQGLHTFGTILLQNNFKGDFVEESAFFYLQLGISKANKCYPYVYYDYARYLEFKISSSELGFGIEYCFNAYYRGAVNECPNCQYRVAQCFEYGELGVDINIQKAYTYYENAAFNGHVDAQFKIALTLIEQGEPTETNIILALKYALKAATKEHCMAIKFISIFYMKGLGVQRNLSVSKWWDKILEVNLKKQNVLLDMEIYSKLEKMVVREEKSEREVVVDGIIAKSEFIKAV